MQSRRKLLQATAALLGGGTALSFGPANAFQQVELDPENPIAQEY